MPELPDDPEAMFDAAVAAHPLSGKVSKTVNGGLQRYWAETEPGAGAEAFRDNAHRANVYTFAAGDAASAIAAATRAGHTPTAGKASFMTAVCRGTHVDVALTNAADAAATAAWWVDRAIRATLGPSAAAATSPSATCLAPTATAAAKKAVVPKAAKTAAPKTPRAGKKVAKKPTTARNAAAK